MSKSQQKGTPQSNQKTIIVLIVVIVVALVVLLFFVRRFRGGRQEGEPLQTPPVMPQMIEEAQRGAQQEAGAPGAGEAREDR